MPTIFMTQWHLDYFRRVERAKFDAMLTVPFFDEPPEDAIRAGLEDLAAGRYRKIESVRDILESEEE